MWETQKIGYPRVFNSQVSSHSASSNLNYWVSVLSSLWLEWCLLQVSRSQLWFSVFASLSRFQGSSLPSNISSLPGPRNIIGSSSVDLKENTLNVFINIYYGFLVYVLFSRPVMSDSLQPHERQHTRPSSPLLSPGVCPSSCPLHQ